MFKILDLFCGGGGAGMGYHQAGFEVTGIDVQRQPRYPFTFFQRDVLSLSPTFLRGFHAIHASPPCQRHSRAANLHGNAEVHPDLIDLTRRKLIASGCPYIIENVPTAPIRTDLILCGTMFRLRIIKHRHFESNIALLAPRAKCEHTDVYDPWHGAGRTADQFRAAQGIDWLPCNGGASRRRGETGCLSNAIPPAYTKFIGQQLIRYLTLTHTHS